jgi:asparagine synthetase B (glutamine-hydrolysing)
VTSLQEGIDAIGDVIYHIETFDVTTIRASTPMFLMSRKIKVKHSMNRSHSQGACLQPAEWKTALSQPWQ